MSEIFENNFIDITTCMDLSLNGITFTEVFDPDAVLYILEHRDLLEKYLESDPDDYNQFARLQKYYKNSKNGRIKVRYEKRLGGFGRLFANHSLSLQGISKLIRGSIAGNLYIDYDFVNCHPVLLKYICEIHECDSPRLNEYVKNRESIINSILDINKINPSINRGYIKKMILSVLNGGEKLYDRLPNKTKWLKKFKKEIRNIHEEMLEENWYPEITKVQQKLKKENKKSLEYNFSGSVLNKALCVYEDYFLKIMTDYFTEEGLIKNNCVLCFDGIMIPKGDYDAQYHAEQLSNIFSEKYGIELKVKTKDFKKFPNFPKVIPKQIEHDYLSDNEYYWFDFMKEMTQEIWEDLESLCLAMRKKINKVMFHVISGDLFIRKISELEPIHIDSKIPKEVFSYKKWFENGSYQVVHITLENLFIKQGILNSIDSYNNITFKPEIESDPREFNTWLGFKSKLLKKDEIDPLKLEPIFDMIKKVWAAGDDEVYRYLLSWFHHAFKKPYIKNKVAIILYSEKQQIGKGIIINEFLIPFIYGERYSMSINGLNDMVSNFNKSLMNKLLVNCDELQSIGSNMSYHAIFDQLKKIVTDPTITIKIKYAEDISNYPDYMNIICSTNNSDCFKIESGDSRYLTLECSDCYRDNLSHFDYFLKHCNQDVADHFFSYCYHLDNYMEVKDLRIIPMTKLKREIMISSFSSPKKFLNKIKMLRDEEPCEDDSDWEEVLKTFDKIKGKLLYQYYKKYCEEENEKVASNTRFGRNIRNHITKYKSKGCIIYKLNEIDI